MMIFHTSGPRLHGLIYAECLSMLPVVDQETMARSLSNSPDAWVAYHDDKVLGFSGVIPPTLLSETAYFWLFATKHFSDHKLVCTRISRRLVADALDRYPVLVGHCTERSSKWLCWLGASLGEPLGPLIPFRIEAR